eukprot:m.118183 g.118183  ORF g.118183 m.118183 type:complete len:118 (-) comp17198_c1_seq4:136-489(-)
MTRGVFLNIYLRVPIQLESTQTTGSIVTSAAEKRRLARSSLEFNLKDRTFIELFPEMVKRIKHDRAENATGRTRTASTESDAPNKDIPADGVISNWFLLLLVVGFAYMVSGIIAQQE